MEGVPSQRHHLHSGGLNCTSQLGSTPLSLLSLTGPISCASMPNATLRTQGFGSLLSVLVAAFSLRTPLPRTEKLKKPGKNNFRTHLKRKNNIRKYFSTNT